MTKIVTNHFPKYFLNERKITHIQFGKDAFTKLKHVSQFYFSKGMDASYKKIISQGKANKRKIEMKEILKNTQKQQLRRMKRIKLIQDETNQNEITQVIASSNKKFYINKKILEFQKE